MSSARARLYWETFPRRGLRARVCVVAAIVTALALSGVMGCGGEGSGDESAHQDKTRESIFGEVDEVMEATGAEKETGIAGWVGVEGARSQAVEEAFVAVTGSTSIIDRRSGRDARAALDAVALRQTVEVTFETLPEAPYHDVAVEIIICP